MNKLALQDRCRNIPFLHKMYHMYKSCWNKLDGGMLIYIYFFNFKKKGTKSQLSFSLEEKEQKK